MTDIVKLKLQFAERQPEESRLGFQPHGRNPVLNFILAKTQILQNFVLAIGLIYPWLVMRRPGDTAQILVINSVLWPRFEAFV
jgi:hypothetical protein